MREGTIKMIYLLDTANIKEIERLIDLYPIDGVTTNPTIVSKGILKLKELVRVVRSVIGNSRMLHVQTISDKAEDMIQEALRLRDLAGGNFYVKIPATPQGVKAIRQLKELGFNVTATAIFTQLQGLIAAKAGADYIAPYVNRLDNISSHGIDVVADLVHLIDYYGLKTQVLAASFKNVDQVYRVSMAGAHAATISPELFDQIMYHPLVEQSIETFKKDANGCYDILINKDIEELAGPNKKIKSA
jgi:fructose-6-phosphate aldolase 2